MLRAAYTSPSAIPKAETNSIREYPSFHQYNTARQPLPRGQYERWTRQMSRYKTRAPQLTAWPPLEKPCLSSWLAQLLHSISEQRTTGSLRWTFTRLEMVRLAR